MGSATRQANFLLPEDLIAELKKVVPRREQSKGKIFFVFID